MDVVEQRTVVLVGGDERRDRVRRYRGAALLGHVRLRRLVARPDSASPLTVKGGCSGVALPD